MRQGFSHNIQLWLRERREVMAESHLISIAFVSGIYAVSSYIPEL